jgi:hypothetical protein
LRHNLKLSVVIQYVGPVPEAHHQLKFLETDVMKYVLLIYQAEGYDPKALSKDEYNSVAARYGALSATPNVKPGLPLGLPRDAVTVRVRNGETVTTPGPYLEQSGYAVGGYYEFDAETHEEAVKLASQIPAASQGGAVEVRPSRIYW